MPEVSNLLVANLNLEEAAAAYRRCVIDPCRGAVPEAKARPLEEQLSGSCAAEVAAFDEFTRLMVELTGPRSRVHNPGDTSGGPVSGGQVRATRHPGSTTWYSTPPRPVTAFGC